MSRNPAVLMRLVASAYAVAERAGSIVRKVLQSGDLGIVEKVCSVHFLLLLLINMSRLMMMMMVMMNAWMEQPRCSNLGFMQTII